MTFQTMCALRVYLRQGDNGPARGFFRRFFVRPLSAHLLQEALRAGVTHASLHMSAMGFTNDARRVSMELNELPTTKMPVVVELVAPKPLLEAESCFFPRFPQVVLELVAPKPLLEQYVQDHAKHLQAATLVMLEGVHVRPQIIEDDGTAHPHHVEYVQAGGVTVPVDHVDVAAPGQLPARVVGE